MNYDHATALSALLSSSPDLIFFLDREGRYRYVGEAAAAALRLMPDEMIGRTPSEIGISSDAFKRFDAQRIEVMRTGRSIRDEAVSTRGRGEVVLDYVIAPVAADGEIIGVVVVIRDVTERRRAEEALAASERKFSTAFDRSPLALTITSFDDGRLVEVNEGFVRMSGYTRQEAIGRTPDEIGLWMNPEVRAERFARLRDGKPVPDVEARFRVKDGTVLTGVIGSALVDINGRPCVLSSVVDITDRKRAEQAKDEFLATLSHELRTPLTSAYGWIKLLARSRDPELLEHGLRAVEESLNTQIRLIDELLDVSRIAAGKMHVDMQPLDLGTVIDTAVEMVRPAAQTKNLDLRMHAHSVMTVFGDAARLKQVAWNLLSNAVKFTPAGGAIDVELHRDGPNAVLVVRDTGEGINAQFLPHVFDRFRQADSSTSRRHGGLGIGLSIVASVVEAHAGSVLAESDGANQGATFTVTIPLLERTNVVQPAIAGDARTDVAHLGGARVLIVDDDEASRRLIMTTLEAAGAVVRECGTVGEAYDVVTEWLPNIVVSDLAMPHEDGYSFIRRLRETGHGIPAVAITAYARSEDEARVRDAGFQRHIAKPFDPEHLVRAIRDLAGQRNAGVPAG